MKGYDAHHEIKDIRIEGLTVGGRPILSAAEGGFLLRQSCDVVFQPATAPATSPLRAVQLGSAP